MPVMTWKKSDQNLIGSRQKQGDATNNETAPAGASHHTAESSVARWLRESGASIPNSDRAWKFMLLKEVIRRMALLPDHDSLYVDDATSRNAVDLVGLMAANFEIEAPKVFSHDAEAVVMTWDLGEIKRLLTIAGMETDLLDVHKPTQIRCHYDISDGPVGTSDLFEILAKANAPRSSVAED